MKRKGYGSLDRLQRIGGTIDMTKSPEESELHKRLRKYGSRGMVYVGSSEGSPISLEAAKNLIPAGPDYPTVDTSETES